jgi:hypothetical protein
MELLQVIILSVVYLTTLAAVHITAPKNRMISEQGTAKAAAVVGFNECLVVC